MARASKGRTPLPGTFRIPGGEERPQCPRCGGPATYRTRDYFYVCPGCTGFRPGGGSPSVLRTVSGEDEVPRRLCGSCVRLNRCSGKSLALLERALGVELAEALRSQASGRPIPSRVG